MKTTINLETLVALCGMGAGVLGLGYALGAKNKMNQVTDKLGCTVDEMLANGSIDISQSLIQDAVEKSVNKATAAAVSNAVSQEAARVRKSVYTDIHTQVTAAVERNCSELESDVKKEINRALADINISRAREEVIKAATEKAAAKFDDDLARVVEAKAHELEQVDKIYTAFANRLTKEDQAGILRLKLS